MSIFLIICYNTRWEVFSTVKPWKTFISPGDVSWHTSVTFSACWDLCSCEVRYCPLQSYWAELKWLRCVITPLLSKRKGRGFGVHAAASLTARLYVCQCGCRFPADMGKLQSKFRKRSELYRWDGTGGFCEHAPFCTKYVSNDMKSESDAEWNRYLHSIISDFMLLNALYIFFLTHNFCVFFKMCVLNKTYLLLARCSEYTQCSIVFRPVYFFYDLHKSVTYIGVDITY